MNCLDCRDSGGIDSARLRGPDLPPGVFGVRNRPSCAGRNVQDFGPGSNVGRMRFRRRCHDGAHFGQRIRTWIHGRNRLKFWTTILPRVRLALDIQPRRPKHVANGNGKESWMRSMRDCRSFKQCVDQTETLVAPSGAFMSRRIASATPLRLAALGLIAVCINGTATDDMMATANVHYDAQCE